MSRRLTLLGATGSVGSSAADVISFSPDSFEVHAVTAHSNGAKLAATARRLRARRAVVVDEKSLATLRDDLFGSGIVATAGDAAMEEAAAEVAAEAQAEGTADTAPAQAAPPSATRIGGRG